jgi:streptogramin lyase
MRVLACFGMFAAGCGGGDDTSSADAPGPTSTSPVVTTGIPDSNPASSTIATTQPVPTDGLIAELDLLGSPDWMAADEHGLWIKLEPARVGLLDPNTGELVDEVDVGGEPCEGIGAGDGSIWACSGGDVARIDAGHPELLSVIPVGKTYTQGELAVTDGQLWMLIGDGSILQGYLTDTQDVWSRFALPVRGTDLDVGEAGLWVVSNVDDAVIHVDLNTGRVVDRIDVSSPTDVAVDSGVWIGTESELVRVDVASGAIDLRVPVGTGPKGSIAVTPGEVWVRNLDPLLTRVDRETGAIVDTYTAEVTSGGDTIYAFGSIWTAAYDDAKLFRFAAPA